MNIKQLKKLLQNFDDYERVYVNQTVGFGVYDEIEGAIVPHEDDGCFNSDGGVDNKGVVLVSFGKDYENKGKYEIITYKDDICYSEANYVNKILLRIIEASSMGSNKKVLGVLLSTYVETIHKSKPDLDYNKIYADCIKYLEKHNYL